MKKIYLILSFVFAITVVIGTANATVKKCVSLVDGTQTSCTSDYLQYDYYADWSATCTTNGVTSRIKGVSFCSDQDARNPNWDWKDPSTIQETITTDSNVDKNIYCWCKMTTPAVSLWVFNEAGGALAIARSAARTFVRISSRPPARMAPPSVPHYSQVWVNKCDCFITKGSKNEKNLSDIGFCFRNYRSYRNSKCNGKKVCSPC